MFRWCKCMDDIRQIISRAVSERLFPCCVAGVTTRTLERQIWAEGALTGEEDAAPAGENTIFDVASITKSIPTACLALMMVEEGTLSLKSRVADYVPEFRGKYRDEVMLYHLLTHTLDYNFRLSSMKDRPAKEIIDHICSADFVSPPGTHFAYANATSILLGLMVERAAGNSLDNLAGSLFFSPLRMHRTTFYGDSFSAREIAPTEYDHWRGRMLQGEVHDESAFTLRQEKVVGSAGLFSTVPNLLCFAEMLLNEGKLNGHRFFTAEMIKRMHTNQIGHLNGCAGLGWELCRREYMGNEVSENAFGKTGFTGCVIIIDPEKGKAVVILSNYTFPRRKDSKDPINEFRRDIADRVFA
ncbi:MAG: serine hydrolase [Chitinivibrionales bacterium]|nr:serine hydrolase [Chitinivibrionales bacterium]